MIKSFVRTIILSTFLLSSVLYAGTDYYVDASSGSDSNNGRSSSAAWKTLNKVNNSSFAAGDRILFKSGQVWRGQLKATSSGYSGNPITYGAYGSGNRPKILGSTAKNSTSNWHSEGSNLWYATNSVKVHQCVFKNETKFSNRVLKKSDLNSQGKLWWDSSNNRVYLYSTSNPASYYGGSVELCHLTNIVHVGSKNYVTFEDLEILYSSASAIYCSGSSNITVDNCVLKCTGEPYSGNDANGQWSGAGIYFFYGTRLTVKNSLISLNWVGIYFQRNDGSSARHTIENNTFSYQIFGSGKGSYGIAFGGTGTYPDYSGTVIRNNTIHHFLQKGIALSHSRNVLIEYNTVHTNYGDGYNDYASGIVLGSTSSTGHIVRYNHVYNITGNPGQWNDGCGIRTREGKNCKIYYNIVHDCIKGIYNQPGNSSGNNNNNEIYNNVCYDNSRYGIWVNSGLSSKKTNIKIRNNICDGDSADIRLEDHVQATGGYNCLMNDSSVSKPGTSSYSNSSTDFYRVDPLFTNASGNNFNLRSNSPCIDKGTNVGLNRDYAGNSVPKGGSVDMGAYEYQGAGDPPPDAGAPTATASASPKSGTAPLTVSFTGSASGGTSPYSYSWNFGDGSTSTSKNPSHTFNSTGTFTVTLTVTDNANKKDTDTETISVSSQSGNQVTLTISSATGSPATGSGGTINPSPGNHNYSKNERVEVRATPKSKYRFGKWTGDVVSSAKGYNVITLTMGGNKSVEAIFCSRCGDVNGDFNVTPTDAQFIFDIFLGKLKNPTFCQKENADVNCDGTRSNPNVTPYDAQAIFDYYLGKNNLPSDCQCNSRSASSSFTITKMSVSEFNLIVDTPQYGDEDEIYIPISIDRAIQCDSFGFDVFYDSDRFEFLGTGRTGLTDDFLQVDGNAVASGLLRVGGYREESFQSMLPGELVILIFKAKNSTAELPNLKIVKTYDALKKASTN